MRYGRTVEEGFLPVYSVDTEEEAKRLLVIACPTNLHGEFVSPELATDRTLDSLRAFGRRLEEIHQRITNLQKAGEIDDAPLLESIRVPWDDTQCPMCGRTAKKQRNAPKLRHRHKCPHGKWCAQSDPNWGSHSNGQPPPRQKCCGTGARRRWVLKQGAESDGTTTKNIDAAR